MKIIEKLQVLANLFLLLNVLEIDAGLFPEIPDDLADYNIWQLYGQPREINTIYRFTYTNGIKNSRGNFDENDIIMTDRVDKQLPDKKVPFNRTTYSPSQNTKRMLGEFVEEDQRYASYVYPDKTTRKFMVVREQSASDIVTKETAIAGIPQVGCYTILVVYGDGSNPHCDLRLVGKSKLDGLPDNCRLGYLENCTRGVALPEKKTTR